MAEKLIRELASKGGKARSNALTSERKREIALMGVDARLAKAGLPKATHGDSSHPLVIDEIEIPCFVLSDGRRVLTQRGIQSGMGMGISGSSKIGEQRLAVFFDGLSAKGIDVKDLPARIRDPIRFIPPWGGSAYGFEAIILADICDVVLAARKALALQKQQIHIADHCEVLMRGFARVGIIALVDEATGYQYDRPRRDLEEQLKKFVSESLRKWVRTFPADYFKHLCRLRGVELRPDMRLPQYFGHLTNNLVYRRLAPGLVRRLKETRNEIGNTSNKLHSWLSADIGYPEVLVHLGTVIGVMKQHEAGGYDDFEQALDRIAPPYPPTPGLFDDPADWDSR